jgi:hypothetical protein
MHFRRCWFKLNSLLELRASGIKPAHNHQIATKDFVRFDVRRGRSGKDRKRALPISPR